MKYAFCGFVLLVFLLPACSVTETEQQVANNYTPDRTQWNIKYKSLNIPVNIEVFLGDEVLKTAALKQRDFEEVIIKAVNEQEGFSLGRQYSLVVEFNQVESDYGFLFNIKPSKQNYTYGNAVKGDVSRCNIPEGCFCQYNSKYAAHLILMLGKDVVGSTLVGGKAKTVSDKREVIFGGQCSWESFAKTAQKAALNDLTTNMHWHLGYLHTLAGEALHR